MAENTYISLFSGYGGLDLAVRCALPEARCVCFVEREAPAAAILASRMEDEGLEDAPIWSDIVTFPSRLFRGRVAGLVGGFPCQDLSVAGRQAGIEGERSGLFFEIIRLVRELESVEWLFLENVPPVLAFPAGTTVLGELAKVWFHAEWGTLRASDVGGSHRRERAFVLAYRSGYRFEWSAERDERQVDGVTASQRDDIKRCGYQMANTSHPRLPQPERCQPYGPLDGGEASGPTSEFHQALFPPGPADLNAWRQVPEWLHAAVEPGLRRLADGANTGMDKRKKDRKENL